MDFYRFWQILDNINEWDPNEPDEGPEDHVEYDHAHGDFEFTSQLVFKNGVFHDVDKDRSFPVIPMPFIKDVVGSPDDTYTVETRVIVSLDYIGGWDAGGGDSQPDRIYGDPEVEIDGFWITNNRTGKSVNLDSKATLDKIISEDEGSIYQITHDWGGGDRVTVYVN